MVINLNSDLSLPRKSKDYLGGNFDWFEQLKLLGVGSIRFIYLTGCKEFNEIKIQSQIINFVNIELLKKGLVLRFSKKNLHKALLIKYSEIKLIEIESQKIRRIINGREIIVSKAEIKVKYNDQFIQIGLPPSNYKSGINFFNKNPLLKFCKHHFNPQVIEDDEFPDWNIDLLNFEL